jgi:amino acid adenylation domain-containing protein
LEDGNIEYLGRIDEQVKIRGYRIELSEIERTIEQSGQTTQAVVVARENKEGNKFLIAYVVSKNLLAVGQEAGAVGFNKEEAIAYLNQRLPEYMVPQFWVELEQIPLTANGKIDKRALPDFEQQHQTQGYTQAADQTETELVKIWEDILETSPIGVHDDFFELGGHSLLAIRLISAIRKTFKTETPISDVFDYPTIAKLKQRIATQTDVEVLPKIEKQTKPKHIPLSYSQERLWFIDRLEGSLQYHIPSVLQLEGNLSVEGLEKSIKKIVERHEVLRSTIQYDNTDTWQELLPWEGWQLEQYQQDQIDKQFVQSFINKPFDLSKDYMFRAALVKQSPNQYQLITVMHHIASDGWSNGIIVRELSELYRAHIQRRTHDLPKLQIQYSDYAIWQRNYLTKEKLEQKLAYWKQKLNNTTPLELPTDYPRPALQSTKGAVAQFKIDKSQTEALNQLSKQQGTTLFMTMLAAFKVLLYRYTGQTDITVGTPTAGRQQKEVEDLIGFFINTLALRTTLNPHQGFNEYITELKQSLLADFSNQDVPFEKVVEATVTQRVQSRSPLFGVMFILQNTPPSGRLMLGDLEMKAQENAHLSSKFDLTFNVIESSDGMRLMVEYCTDLFSEQTIQNMQHHYQNLLSEIVNNPTQNISQLKMLDIREESQLREQFNNTHKAHPYKHVIEAFEDRVSKNPKSVALSYQQEQLSYEQLNQRADHVAQHLLQNGVTPNSLVGIYLDRSIEMVVAIIGVLKSGAAYVPIDTEYPQERIGYMIENSEAQIVITNNQLPSLLSDCKSLNIKDLQSEPLQTNPSKPTITPDQLAYVIYTSGSTGKPKGVMIPHRGLLNLTFSQIEAFNLTPQTTTLQFASIAFDAACSEIFTTLVSGGKLVIMPKEALSTQEAFGALITNQNIDVVTLPPSFIETNINHLAKLKTLVSAGEALSVQTAKAVKQMGIRLINAYGPTEVTVCATLTDEPLTQNRSVNIGKPIYNTTIKILDANLNLCPVGVYGEICVSGDGLAKGYIHNPDQTQAQFINDPFTPNQIIYKTGDIGRWNPDGSIEYQGRKDEQVKVRGYRIELQEIENVIKQHNQISQVAVTKQSQQLTAWVVLKDKNNQAKIAQEIKEHLQKTLPQYMIPSNWEVLDQLPLTPNGKVDRKTLEHQALSASKPYRAPQTKTEQQLAKIWQELLHIETPGVDDNFFERGGHSLMAMRLVSAMNAAFDMEITIREVFRKPTIAEMANFIDSEEKEDLMQF